ncbi:MAG TPA: GDSL-type esterase/lipase family protein [Thermoanaerobaculia bacterium]|nr:GDSL-type esterase/lipase family protein [Thermoanaerobaculia bacterium]
MRRFFFWYLPLGACVLATAVFGYGFYLGVSGGAGTPVNGSDPGLARNDVAPAGTIRPIILGDSVAKGSGDETGLGIGGVLDSELKSRRIQHDAPINLAVNGSKTPDLLALLGSKNVQVIIAGANVVIISIGGNDLYGSGEFRTGAPPDPGAILDHVLDNVRQAVGKVRVANPKARIFLIGLYNPFVRTPYGKILSPYVADWNSRLLESFRADPNITVVQTYDLFSHVDRLSADRFHPGSQGYRLIGRRIADSLK